MAEGVSLYNSFAEFVEDFDSDEEEWEEEEEGSTGDGGTRALLRFAVRVSCE